jgi:hypothetical protein
MIFLAIRLREGETVAVVLASIACFAAVRIVAGIGLMIGRRWGWVLGCLLGVLDLVAAYSLWQATPGVPGFQSVARPFLIDLSGGTALLICLLTPATIRWVLGHVPSAHPLAN